MAVLAAPDDRAVHGARVEIYAQRRRDATSLMAKGIYEAAVKQSAERAGIAVPEMTRERPLG